MIVLYIILVIYCIISYVFAIASIATAEKKPHWFDYVTIVFFPLLVIPVSIYLFFTE
jgi:hypothetical protein